MLRRLRILTASTLLVLSGVFLGAVAPAAAACSTTSITLYEDNSGGGDSITKCVNVPSLTAVPHTQSGICAAVLKFDDNWNDCVNSFRMTLSSTKCLALYIHANYSGTFSQTLHSGPQTNTLVNIQHPNSDALSSFKFFNKTGGTCVL